MANKIPKLYKSSMWAVIDNLRRIDVSFHLTRRSAERTCDLWIQQLNGVDTRFRVSKVKIEEV